MPLFPSQQNQITGSDGVVWKDFPQAALLNLVTTEIVRNFPRPLQDDNRHVHAPTLFAALGSVCGFATQTSLLALIQSGLRSEQDMVAHTLANGRTFLFGEQLNQLLMEGDASVHSPGLWPCLSSAARHHGCSAQDLPDLSVQFASVASRLGTADEGIPDVDARFRPLIATDNLREAMWAYIEPIFQQDYPDQPGPYGPLPRQFWGSAMAVATAMLFNTMFKIMNVRTALTIILQSAIFGSKIIET
ncbi:hypothetical protein PY793_08985 [Acetobacter fabarum]|uniref:hypothetical protein n=1 Tax=Acetobacter fabarum TaxID=483199 RepID=UPI00312B63E5